MNNEHNCPITDVEIDLLRRRNTKGRPELLRRLNAAGFRPCLNCDSLLPLASFNAHKKSWDGLNSQCRVCHTASSLKYERDNLERVYENKRKRRAANPERYRKRERKRRAADPERYRKRGREYYADHPEQSLARVTLRKVTKLKLIPLWAYKGDTLEERRALRTKHHSAIDAGSYGTAKYTRSLYRRLLKEIEEDRKHFSEAFRIPLATDHHHPLSERGEHCPLRNLRIMSAALNGSKGAKIPGEDWTPPPPTFRKVTVRVNRVSPSFKPSTLENI